SAARPCTRWSRRSCIFAGTHDERAANDTERNMMRRVAVIGGAATPNGKLQTAPDAPLQALEHEILAPLVIDAMAASGLPKEEVGALVFSLCRPYTLQKYFATFLANYLRLPLSGTIMEVLGNGM